MSFVQISQYVFNIFQAILFDAVNKPQRESFVLIPFWFQFHSEATQNFGKKIDPLISKLKLKFECKECITITSAFDLGYSVKKESFKKSELKMRYLLRKPPLVYHQLVKSYAD